MTTTTKMIDIVVITICVAIKMVIVVVIVNHGCIVVITRFE